MDYFDELEAQILSENPTHEQTMFSHDCDEGI